MSSVKLYKSIDSTSANCAGAIGELAGAINDAYVGEGVEIFIKDEATRKDVYAWAKKTRHKIVVDESVGDKLRLVVEKVA